jgi:hypothetical protein
MHRLPHLFRPDFPFSGGDEPFLFQGIEERVTAAEILRDEDGCHVVSVTYQPPPYPGLIVSGSAVLFWISAADRMVMRMQGKLGHRFPTDDEVTWTGHTVLVRNIQVNHPLPDDTFQFTPPPDAIPESGGQCGGFIGGGGGGGFVQHGPDDRHRLEHHGSHEWQGETLIEHSKWKIRGITLTFERHLTFSADGKELHIRERVAGPQGQKQADFTLPLS